MAEADYGQGADTLSRAAKMVQSAKAELDKTGNNLESQLTPTKSSWVGQGGRAFTQLYEAWLAKQKQIVKTLDEFEASLMSTEKDNVSTDESQSANVSNLHGRLG